MTTGTTAAKPRLVTCAGCGTEFKPSRRWQKYCIRACRNRRHTEYPAGDGPRGTVRSVRRIKSGVSVVTHFTDPDEAARAIARNVGDPVTLVMIDG